MELKDELSACGTQLSYKEIVFSFFVRNAFFGFFGDRFFLVFFLLHGTDRFFPVFALDLSNKPM